MKKLKKFLLVSMFSFLALILVGCSCSNNKTFSVTFDSNGGTKVKKQEVKINEKVEEPEDPTKEGYIFKGWYLSGKKYDFDKKVTKDIKLRARWTKEAIKETEDVIYTPVYVAPTYTAPIVEPTPVVVKENATLSIQTPSNIYLNREANFIVSAKANDDENTVVVGKATISNPEALEKLEYLGKDEVWYEISIEDIFGEEGFALVDGDVSFRATFNTIGNYELNVQLVDVENNLIVAETTTTVTVEKMLSTLELTKPEHIYLNRESELTLQLTANDDIDTMVVGKATISNPEVLEKLEYLGADGNWYEMSLNEMFGNEEGFALVDGSSNFRATFNAIGDYELTVSLVSVEDESVVTELTETITVEAKAAEVTFDIPEEFIVGETAEFTVSTIANDNKGTMVVGSGSLSNPEAIEKLEYLEVNDNNWYELPTDSNFGPATGFELTDATSTFRVEFNTAGEYEVTFQILNAETNELVTETTATIVVRQVKAAEVTFDIPEEFIVGETAEFTVSTIANDNKGTIVVGSGSLSNPEAIEKLEYLEVNDNNWYELPTDSNFGPATGFELTDATSTFRVSFNTAGEYEVTFQILNAETNEVVTETTSTITVIENSQVQQDSNLVEVPNLED